jgi:hypothetical protein
MAWHVKSFDGWTTKGDNVKRGFFGVVTHFADAAGITLR